MIDDDVKQEFEKVNARLDRIEQFLPTVATKADVERSASKDDLERFATKDDLERFATKEDVSTSRRELEAVIETLATKADLERLRDESRANAELTRQHFDLIAESLRDEIRLALEGHMGVTSRVETLEGQHRRLERRVSTLETSRARPKK